METIVSFGRCARKSLKLSHLAAACVIEGEATRNIGEVLDLGEVLLRSGLRQKLPDVGYLTVQGC